MAKVELRQILYINKTKGITWFLRRPKNQRCLLARSCAGTVWTIVFIFTCTAKCETDVSLLRSEELRAYDVSVTRFSSTYYPRTYSGLLVTDGKCHRLTFYWFDPVAECEQMDSLAFSDFLFSPDKVSYWYHKDADNRHTLPVGSSQASEGGQLPKENNPDSIFQSILNLVVYNRTTQADNADTIETARFFQKARHHKYFNHTVDPPTVESDTSSSISGPSTDNFRIPNQLPFGRKYCKQIDQNSNVVWVLSKTTISRDMVRVIVKPKPLCEILGLSDIFDANSLGLWPAVPRPYRQFWSFWHRSFELHRAPSATEAQRLYKDINSCLHGSLPDEVKLAMHKLLFKASLETGSSDAMSLSARQYFQTYKCLAQQPVDLILVELGRITADLRKKWSDEQIRNFILPMLRPMVDAKVFNRGFADKAVFDQIKIRGWTWYFYGQLVLESIQEATSLDPEFLERFNQIVTSPDSKENIMDSETKDDLYVKPGEGK